MTRRTAIASGVVVGAVYLGAALLSGSLSPMASGPMLDGLGPVNYRWVAPPPELAATNQPPSGGRFQIPLSPDGSEDRTFVLSDNQMTLILPRGAFPPRPGEDSLRLRVEPIDPATLAPPPAGTIAFGNAYRLAFTYRPSGEPATDQILPIDVFLVYPVTLGLSSPEHRLAFSGDGEVWSIRPGTDGRALQQVESSAQSPGYVLVVGEPGEPSPSPGGWSPRARRSLAIGLIVAAVIVALVGSGLILRARR